MIINGTYCASMGTASPDHAKAREDYLAILAAEVELYERSVRTRAEQWLIDYEQRNESAEATADENVPDWLRMLREHRQAMGYGRGE